jgi:multidrug efflux pump subunit AcrA (membrane-fusion protein)
LISRPRSFAALSALGMASLLLLSACGASASSSAPASGAGGAQAKPGGPPAAPVSTAKAANGPITAGITFTGDVTASQQVNLAPKVAGLVTKLAADVGDHVTAGQQVAELDHLTQDAALAQA